MKIILIGMKASGKSTIGKILAKTLKVDFIELDKEIEKKHNKIHRIDLTYQEIFTKLEENYFRNLETETLVDLNIRLANKDFIFSCGGGTPIQTVNQEILKKMGLIIFLDTHQKIIKSRIKDKIWQKNFDKLYIARWPIYEKLADIKIRVTNEMPKIIASKIRKII